MWSMLDEPCQGFIFVDMALEAPEFNAVRQRVIVIKHRLHAAIIGRHKFSNTICGIIATIAFIPQRPQFFITGLGEPGARVEFLHLNNKIVRVQEAVTLGDNSSWSNPFCARYSGSSGTLPT